MSDAQQQEEIEDRGDVVAAEEPAAPTAEPEASAPTPEPAPQVERDYRIPKERFDEVNEQLREARLARQEERQARLDAEARLREATAPKVPVFDARAAEADYLDAVANGETEKAKALWSKIRDYERTEQSERMSAALRAEVEKARAQVQIDVMAEALIEKYPFLDPANESANQEAIKEVVEWRDYYIAAKKLSPAQALKQAVNRIAQNYAKGQTTIPTQGIAAGIDRAQAQRQANAKAASQLPPNTAQAGIGERATRAQKADVEKMTDTEFAALTPEERAKLRGDTLA